MAKEPKGGGGFNTPFKGLKLKTEAKPGPARPPPPKKEARPAAPSEEDALFLEAMAGVAPIPARSAPPQRSAPVPVAQNVQDEAEALAALAELVAGQGELDVNDSMESIEGGAPDLDRRVLRALRRGEYALQGNLDLHGMTRIEAKDAVETFLLNARRDGKRCVLVVHGRGLNSPDHIPVLKEQLKVWLNCGRVAKSVLAFASARPQDGGTGALYVLLRR